MNVFSEKDIFDLFKKNEKLIVSKIFETDNPWHFWKFIFLDLFEYTQLKTSWFNDFFKVS